MAPIFFNRAKPLGREFEYIQAAIDSMHLAGDGQFTRKTNQLLEHSLGAKKVLLTTSCTHALEMAALLIGVQPGDEVIVPSFTFVSTAGAFVVRGAKPVFADIRRDTLNLDHTQLERHITPRTKAIVPVHYAGISCDMDAIETVTKDRGISLIEDNAHGLFGRYKGRWLGTLGRMATQSFHETKNFSAGEGGALIINDPSLVERAEIIREKGTNRNRFFRGEVDKYTWVDYGSSYLPSEILAAYLFAQLEQRQTVQTVRKRIWDYYRTSLPDWAAAHDVLLPTVPADCEPAYHLFYLVMPTPRQRERMLKHLSEREIRAVFHYMPLNTSEMGRRFGGTAGSCPVAEAVSDRLIRLPFHNSLTDAEQARVVEAVRAFQ